MLINIFVNIYLHLPQDILAYVSIQVYDKHGNLFANGSQAPIVLRLLHSDV